MITFLIAVVICFVSSDSSANTRSFSSLTKNGRYFTVFPVDGNSNPPDRDWETKQITTAIKNVIKACIQSRGIKVEALPTFDIEYLFLNIRGKSVGEEVEVNILCPDDGETYVPTTIPIDEISCEE